MENTPRVRLTAVPDDGVLVVRGDELDRVLLAEDASRFRERFPAWDRYGVSAFYASTSDEVDALCGSRLLRFDQVAVFRRDDLERAGIEIVPTFQEMENNSLTLSLTRSRGSRATGARTSRAIRNG